MKGEQQEETANMKGRAVDEAVQEQLGVPQRYTAKDGEDTLKTEKYAVSEELGLQTGFEEFS